MTQQHQDAQQYIIDEPGMPWREHRGGIHIHAVLHLLPDHLHPWLAGKQRGPLGPEHVYKKKEQSGHLHDESDPG